MNHYTGLVLFALVAGLLAISDLHADEEDSQIRFTGDFRYRIEAIEIAGDDLDPRTRHRIRARFGVHAKIADDTRAVIQLASGSDDLISSNQTLSGTFSSKNIVLDLAYGEYKPNALRQRLTVIAGKSTLLFFRPGRTELLWDSDLRPEGLSGFFEVGTGDPSLKVLGGWYILEERMSDDNSYLLAGQLVWTFRRLPFFNSLKTGMGYFHFVEIEDRTPFFNDDFFGNSSYPDTTLPEDPSDPPVIVGRHSTGYQELEWFFEAGFDWQNRPVVLLGDLVINTKPEDDNTGWLLGFKIGEVSGRGSWAIRYNYRRLEKDAVFGTFSDSNFRGSGTDGKGHEFGFSFGARKNVKLLLSYFYNMADLDDPDTYQLLMFDVVSSF